MTIDIQHQELSFTERLRPFLQNSALFHAAFIGLLTFELIVIAVFFSFLIKSAFVAISVALFVMTLFCYALLRIWMTTKKKQEFEKLVDQFQDSQNSTISFTHYAHVTKSLHGFAETIRQSQDEFLSGAPLWLSPLKMVLNRFFQRLIRDDRFFMQELILERIITLWIDFIKLEPTHLDAHASLATTYITLSTLFASSKKGTERFKTLVQKATEEFKILNYYAPNDAWVHTQLAKSYHNLGLPLEEIKEYEALRELDPRDADVLLKLGLLYFGQNQTAKALTLYEELKTLNPKKADELIRFYA